MNPLGSSVLDQIQTGTRAKVRSVFRTSPPQHRYDTTIRRDLKRLEKLWSAAWNPLCPINPGVSSMDRWEDSSYIRSRRRAHTAKPTPQLRNDGRPTNPSTNSASPSIFSSVNTNGSVPPQNCAATYNSLDRPPNAMTKDMGSQYPEPSKSYCQTTTLRRRSKPVSYHRRVASLPFELQSLALSPNAPSPRGVPIYTRAQANQDVHGSNSNSRNRSPETVSRIASHVPKPRQASRQRQSSSSPQHQPQRPCYQAVASSLRTKNELLEAENRALRSVNNDLRRRIKTIRRLAEGLLLGPGELGEWSVGGGEVEGEKRDENGMSGNMARERHHMSEVDETRAADEEEMMMHSCHHAECDQDEAEDFPSAGRRRSDAPALVTGGRGIGQVRERVLHSVEANGEGTARALRRSYVV